MRLFGAPPAQVQLYRGFDVSGGSYEPCDGAYLLGVSGNCIIQLPATL